MKRKQRKITRLWSFAEKYRLGFLLNELKFDMDEQNASETEMKEKISLGEIQAHT